MCRNHRGFLLAAIAASRLGCDLVPLNNDFAGPQLGEVLAREGVSAAFHDEEFEAVFDESGFDGLRIVAWHDRDQARPNAHEPGGAGSPRSRRCPAATGRVILLTSGTTGTPKGAARTIRPLSPRPDGRGEPARPRPDQAVPRSGTPFVLAPPLFHLFGLGGTMAAFGLVPRWC